MADAKGTREQRATDRLDVQRSAIGVLQDLRGNSDLRRFVDPKLGIPDVFCGKGEIRLVVLGQDPTVKNAASRRTIRTVLNLDKPGALKNYLSRVCEGLGLDLDQHVYATNYLKNFFVEPPTQIDEIDVFEVFGPEWLPLLQDELAQFPQVPLITLGQPLLRALVLGDASPLVHDYWGYSPRWKSGDRGPLLCLEAQHNRLHRTVFPFPHQPSFDHKTRGQFYRERLPDYTGFVREVALSR